ncbi:hypothetical protein [Mucilaginibacter glaciei]|uniref:Uncharacterized protein n=1 Tax=Mucilaginibacter glaciei TaxID=2772109 RepID=A0A926NW77_9SPHI|nr:hypothetical protein [Mucilaginibacter glaciei]MBD1392854.1 hypothetical protein [Mucilaginibacter glaciei]
MEENEVQDQLQSIRSMMERSSKFISLSGLSGVLAGVYALVGVALAYFILNYTARAELLGDFPNSPVPALLFIALAVLVLSLITGLILTLRKAKQKGQNPWGRSSRQLLYNLAVPLVTGGLLSLILISRGYFGIVAPATLIFYGLALVSASNVTYKDVQYLGIIEIALGLFAALLPGYGLVFWAIGFGVLHIVYGSIMYFKYDK